MHGLLEKRELDLSRNHALEALCHQCMCVRGLKLMHTQPFVLLVRERASTKRQQIAWSREYEKSLRLADVYNN